ncbi:MAG: NAD(P)-dependent oxidoreductase [Candidatus Aminicenantes bacterium]|nr:NAD(P)-dependent oxidoreductase [Candidatus Aminicenantes bacterium]
MKKKIVITGAGGLISNGIAAYLKKKDKDIEITGVSPEMSKIDNFDHVIIKRFGETLSIPDKKFDLIIHCAFDKENKSNELNTRGTIDWAGDAEKAGIKKHIFLSSISSQSEFLSPYGKSKKDLEKWFLEKNYFVFRLGLVIANGGMFGRLLSSIKNSPVIPLISGGKFLVFPTDPETIYDHVYKILQDKVIQDQGKIWNLQYKQGTSLKDILILLKKRTGKKVIFFPVPYYLIYPVVKLVEIIKIPGIDIDTGNLKGLKWNSRISLGSDLESLGYPERDLAEIINNLDL